MQVNLLTPIRKGDPYSWGEDLTYMLNKNGIVARHVHSLPMLQESCAYRKYAEQNHSLQAALGKILSLYQEIEDEQGRG